MKGIRLQVVLLPYEQAKLSPDGKGPRQDTLLPWLHICQPEWSLQYLADDITDKFSSIHAGRGSLQIKHLESDFGDVLDLTDKVGDVFDDRTASGDNRTSIVKVARYPPGPDEQTTPFRLGSLLPESTARPKKRRREEFRIPDSRPVLPLPSIETPHSERGDEREDSHRKRRKIHSKAFGRHNVDEVADSIIPDDRRSHGFAPSEVTLTQDPVVQVEDSQVQASSLDPTAYGTLSFLFQHPRPPSPSLIEIPDSPRSRLSAAKNLGRQSSASRSPELRASVQRSPPQIPPSVGSTQTGAAAQASSRPVQTSLLPSVQFVAESGSLEAHSNGTIDYIWQNQNVRPGEEHQNANEPPRNAINPARPTSKESRSREEDIYDPVDDEDDNDIVPKKRPHQRRRVQSSKTPNTGRKLPANADSHSHSIGRFKIPPLPPPKSPKQSHQNSERVPENTRIPSRNGSDDNPQLVAISSHATPSHKASHVKPSVNIQTQERSGPRPESVPEAAEHHPSSSSLPKQISQHLANNASEAQVETTEAAHMGRSDHRQTHEVELDENKRRLVELLLLEDWSQGRSEMTAAILDNIRNIEARVTSQTPWQDAEVSNPSLDPRSSTTEIVENRDAETSTNARPLGQPNQASSSQAGEVGNHKDKVMQTVQDNPVERQCPAESHADATRTPWDRRRREAELTREGEQLNTAANGARHLETARTDISTQAVLHDRSRTQSGASSSGPKRIYKPRNEAQKQRRKDLAAQRKQEAGSSSRPSLDPTMSSQVSAWIIDTNNAPKIRRTSSSSSILAVFSESPRAARAVIPGSRSNTKGPVQPSRLSQSMSINSPAQNETPHEVEIVSGVNKSGEAFTAPQKESFTGNEIPDSSPCANRSKALLGPKEIFKDASQTSNIDQHQQTSVAPQETVVADGFLISSPLANRLERPPPPSLPSGTSHEVLGTSNINPQAKTIATHQQGTAPLDQHSNSSLYAKTETAHHTRSKQPPKQAIQTKLNVTVDGKLKGRLLEPPTPPKSSPPEQILVSSDEDDRQTISTFYSEDERNGVRKPAKAGPSKKKRPIQAEPPHQNQDSRPTKASPNGQKKSVKTWTSRKIQDEKPSEADRGIEIFENIRDRTLSEADQLLGEEPSWTQVIRGSQDWQSGIDDSNIDPALRNRDEKESATQRSESKASTKRRASVAKSHFSKSRSPAQAVARSRTGTATKSRDSQRGLESRESSAAFVFSEDLSYERKESSTSPASTPSDFELMNASKGDTTKKLSGHSQASKAANQTISKSPANISEDQRQTVADKQPEPDPGSWRKSIGRSLQVAKEFYDKTYYEKKQKELKWAKLSEMKRAAHAPTPDPNDPDPEAHLRGIPTFSSEDESIASSDEEEDGETTGTGYSFHRALRQFRPF